jgi:hypothetical protein
VEDLHGLKIDVIFKFNHFNYFLNSFCYKQGAKEIKNWGLRGYDSSIKDEKFQKNTAENILWIVALETGVLYFSKTYKKILVINKN